jgi:hypothetical protein
MKTITINVTSEDISKGEQFSCGNCPVALACKRAFGCPCAVSAFNVRVYANGSDTKSTADIRLPQIVQSFIIRFDYQTKSNPLGPVEPFTFELSVPE